MAKQGIRVTVVDRDDEIGTAPRALIRLFPTLDGFEAWASGRTSKSAACSRPSSTSSSGRR
ncbi:hypothetical protein [Mycobacterium sp. ACS1612]|uniref:hypothetical protein n=1 Tax=Mycobacterium sp. ACS1612 TaxID=1834117 RepID=UPI0012EA3429